MTCYSATSFLAYFPLAVSLNYPSSITSFNIHCFLRWGWPHVQFSTWISRDNLPSPPPTLFKLLWIGDRTSSLWPHSIGFMVIRACVPQHHTGQVSKSSNTANWQLGGASFKVTPTGVWKVAHSNLSQTTYYFVVFRNPFWQTAG